MYNCFQSLNAYVFRNDVDDTWPQATDEFFSYIHSDILGSSSLYTEGLAKATHGGLRYVRGEAVQVVEYKPFGVERYVLNPLIEAGPRYTGQVFDLDTDLYYYNARYYDPALGRFIQPDSIIQDPYSPQLLNPYSYVINNPLKYNDPSGNRVPIEVSTEDGGTELNSVSQVDTGWDFFREGRDTFGLGNEDFGAQYIMQAVWDHSELLQLLDPTPYSDYLAIRNALANDDYLGVAFGAIGFLPGIGDVIGKGAREIRGAARSAKNLPKLTGSIEQAFEGGSRIRTFKAGDRVYRSPQIGELVDNPGAWFGTRRTATRAGTESMSNIVKWGNPVDTLRTYEFVSDFTAYWGKVAGGNGYQMLIPRATAPSDVLRFIGEVPLR